MHCTTASDATRCADNRTDLTVHFPRRDAPDAFTRGWMDASDRAEALASASHRPRVCCELSLETFLAGWRAPGCA